MQKRMRVMAAYERSVFSDTAIQGLKSAGLPTSSEIMIVSVANLAAVSPPISEFDLSSLASLRADAVIGRARDHRNAFIDDTGRAAAKVAEDCARLAPGWVVDHRVLEGEPIAQLLQQADKWQPDLIVLGSHDRGPIGRYLLGSVSLAVAERSRSNVRVVKGRPDEPDAKIRNIVAVRGPQDAARVIESVRRRDWPDGTEILVVTVGDGTTNAEPASSEENGLGSNPRIGPFRIADMSFAPERMLSYTELIAMADEWDAGTVFVAANLEGETAATDMIAMGLLKGANCTIEIVR